MKTLMLNWQNIIIGVFLSKKILIVCDSCSGGIFDYSRVLYRKLAKNLNIEFLFHKQEGIFGRLRFYRKLVQRLIRENNIILDVQCLIWPVTLFILPILKLRHHTLVFEAHDDPLTTRTKYRPKFIRKMILRNSDKIIAHSVYSEKIMKMLGYENVVYIPLGSGVENPKVLPQRKAREKLRIRRKNVILLFGLITRNKGLDVLLKSIPFIKRCVEDVLVIVAGRIVDDWMVYERIIRDLRIQDDLLVDSRYIPWSELSIYFSACDVVVTPYKEITNSIVPFVAYAFKRPVVASDIGAFREVVRDKETGLLVEKGNPKSLAKGLCLLLKNKKLCRRYGITGNKMLKTVFSWKSIKESYTKLFSDIVS